MKKQKPNANVSLQVMPRTTAHQNLIPVIDKVIALIKKSGVTYEVGPMETTMEGDLETLLEIVKQSQLLCIKAGAQSVFSNVKIAYNPTGVMTIAQKTTKHRSK